MRKILLLLLLSSCNPVLKCWHDNTPKVKDGKFEIIDMGGVSTINQYQLDKEDFRYDAITNNHPRIKLSKYRYKHCLIHLRLGANDDTGNDRLMILFGGEPIFETEFGDGISEKEFDFFDNDSWEQLEFVVDNPNTPNHSAGAFTVTIKIKRL